MTKPDDGSVLRRHIDWEERRQLYDEAYLERQNPRSEFKEVRTRIAMEIKTLFNPEGNDK